MFVVRDTRGCELGPQEQLNRFPANPYCCITWMLEGQTELITQGHAEHRQLLPRHFVHGCQTRPCVSRNLGERHSFSAVFYPDAFHALFGVDLALIKDDFVAAAEVLPDLGGRMVEAVALAPGDAERRRIIEEFMAEHATALGTSAWVRLRRMGVNVGLRVASGLLGVGPRQAQRLARREGGMSLLNLSQLWRSERSLRKVREALDRGQTVHWATHAGRCRLRRSIASRARM